MTKPPARFFHDVDDPFRFAHRALNDALRANRARLPIDLRQLAESFYLEKLTHLATRYDPRGSSAAVPLRQRVRARTATRAEWRALQHYTRSRRRCDRANDIPGLRTAGEAFATTVEALGLPLAVPLAFSSWAYRILVLRYADFLRDWLGDARYHTLPQLLSLEERDGHAPGAGSEDEVGFQTLLDEIDHDKLSLRARNALRQLGPLIVQEDLSVAEAAARLGKPVKQALNDMKRLKLELQGAVA